jgi:hypothetical protein
MEETIYDLQFGDRFNFANEIGYPKVYYIFSGMITYVNGYGKLVQSLEAYVIEKGMSKIWTINVKYLDTTIIHRIKVK